METSVYDRVEGWTGPGTLYHVRGSATSGAPVVITHGTFSNASTCVPVAVALGAHRPAYVIEWRGRDVGRGRVQRFDYTDLAEGELRGAFAHVAGLHGGPVHFVAHSGGGLAVLLALALYPDTAAMLRSVTIVAAQATHTHLTDWRGRVMSFWMMRLGRRLGYVPVRLLPIGPCNEAVSLKENWYAWTRDRKITTRDGRDVFSMLAGQPVPAMVLAGAADKNIAPAEGCRVIAEALGPKTVFEVCGLDTGHAEDFDHARVFRSRAAAVSVYPMIADWIARH